MSGPRGVSSLASARKGFKQGDIELAKDIGEFYDDPLGYVLYAFPWGQPGTRLAKQEGPDQWQIDVLNAIGESVRNGMGLADAMPTLIAVASGHGIGKTACIAWIILWFISTRDHPQIVVTAGKREQLSGKTWRELAKWQKMAINGHWFVWTATELKHALFPETWNAQAIAWSKNAPENFAGTHEEHVLVIFDEASAIDDVIWETTDGAMTTPGAMWIAFGNPTKTTGRFFQCFGKFRKFWKTWHIDSRTAKMANRKLLDQWVEAYGEDSDFVKVRIRGQFPSAGDLQFIATEDVNAAMARKATDQSKYGRVLSIDIARHGMDQTVFCFRQGRKVEKFKKYRIPDLMQIAARAAEAIDEWQPDAVFIDATGIGWGVVDRLHQMGYTQVIGVQTGEKAFDADRFVNRRAELWYAMREWIQDGGSLPEDQELADELTAVEYGFDGKQRYVLESKKDLRDRDLPSPDTADALALSFTSPVAPTKAAKDTWRNRLKTGRRRRRSPMAA
ncbi:MAG TPA: terminase [Lysobacter sp.]|nr:terminase [Lysobacter sp.]